MKRNFLFIFLIGLVSVAYIGRLLELQVLQKPIYKLRQNLAVKALYDYPERGYIYDRNGKLLVSNQLSYDIMVVPKEVQPLDTLELCSLLKISKATFKKQLNKAKKYASWLSSVFVKQLSKEDFAFLQEKLSRFKGFYAQRSIIRYYPVKSAANILGYIGEVNEDLAKKNAYYHPGELIGIRGVEKQYEKVLRGVKGKKYLQRNSLNEIIGAYKNGIYDTLPVKGKDLTLTIDSALQQYGEQLMKGKRGGIVAIAPATGEILASVSTPTYNPNEMVGRKRSVNSVKLFGDTINKPMYDRGLQAIYPPGSPFKIIDALIGLQEGVINQRTAVFCHHGYRYGRQKKAFMRCHCGIVGRPIQLKIAIAKSCNTYFGKLYQKIIDNGRTPSEGLSTWSNYVKSFGLGNYLGYDLPSGKKGFIPDGKYYDNRYTFRWKAITTISNAIGQGEILVTPIQLANMSAAVANRGFFYTPHIVKKIAGIPIKNPKYTVPKKTAIDSKYFAPIIDAMEDVFKFGTARWSKVKGIAICGKTGTSENFIRIGKKKQSLPDHSIFIAFAPKENPKIAVAVFIENGGFGSAIAAPIASLLIEKYIKGKVSRQKMEQYIKKLSLQKVYDKIAKLKRMQ